MSDEIRITRWMQIDEKNSYKIEWTSEDTAILPIIVAIEERVDDIKRLTGKPSPEISPKTAPQPKKGLSVVMLAEGDADFSLPDMRIDKIGKRSSGSRKDESTWERQGMTVSDVTGTLAVVAWGDQIKLFDGLMLNDVVNIDNIRELKMFKGKKQAHLGSDSEVVKQ